MERAGIESWYAGRTIVVTGAYGYLGSTLSQTFLKAGARVRRATRRHSTGDPDAWQGELTDESFVKKLVEGADAVFHFAGQTSVPVSHERPIEDLRANVESTVRLLDACRTRRAPPASFIYAGTATEVGLTDTTPTAHGAPDRPLTVYDANKLAAEQLVGVYTHLGAVRGVTLRIANVFGPGPTKSAPERGVTNKVIARALAGNGLTYFGDGALLRDYVYVEDVLEAFVRAGAASSNAPARSFVIARGEGHSLRETFELVADVVAELGRKRVSVGSVPWPAGTHAIDRRSFVADIAPLRDWLRWSPTTTLREGIRRTALAFIDAEASQEG